MSGAAVVIISGGLNRGGYDPMYNNRIAEKLSKDKEYECLLGGFVIYANKTRWFMRLHCTSILIWIPDNDWAKKAGKDAKALIEDAERDSHYEYYSTWLPNSVNHIKWIINCHPNLKAPNWYWSFRKLFEI